MRALILTNLLPYPLDNGGKLRSNAIIRSFSKIGADIDLLGFVEGDGAFAQKAKQVLSTGNVHCHPIRHKITTASNMPYMVALAMRSLVSSKPFGIVKCQSRVMRKKIFELMQTHNYDLVFIEHLQMTEYLGFIKKICPDTTIILDEQNCETEIVKQKINKSRNMLLRMFLKLEEKKLERFERASVKMANKTIVLSEDDRAKIALVSGVDADDLEIVPIALDDHGVATTRVLNNKSALRLLFVGTLSWEANSSGLVWFAENVLPLLDNVKVLVAGKGASNNVLTRLNDSRINILGYVDSLDDLFDDCDVMIVPLLLGSGQRVKILESFSRGLPVISTTIGASGIGYHDTQDILIADNAKSFAKCINALRDNKLRTRLSENGRKLYDNEYSPEAVDSRLLDIVNGYL